MYVLLIALTFWRVSVMYVREASACDPALLQGQKVLN